MSQHCWAQHVACVWPLCCDMLGVVGSSLTSFKLESTTPNMLQHGGQTHVTCCAQQCCNMLRWHVAIVWPGLNQTTAFTGQGHQYYYDHRSVICVSQRITKRLLATAPVLLIRNRLDRPPGTGPKDTHHRTAIAVISVVY